MCTSPDTPEPPPRLPEPPHMPNVGGQPSKSGGGGATSAGAGGIYAGTLLTRDYNAPGSSGTLLSSTGGSGVSS